MQQLHGLVSNAEWTGVLVSTLLEEVGVDPKAKWIIAEGADSLALSRSVPLAKGLDDAMVALYALIAGREAKEGVSMGHAGALVMGDAGTLASKTQRLTDADARVFGSIETLMQACVHDFAALRT